jgi:hypothetical protein
MRSMSPAPLDIKKQAQDQISSRKNLILIDHMALPFEQYGRSENCPRREILVWLEEIVHDRNNLVVVTSNQG